MPVSRKKPNLAAPVNKRVRLKKEQPSHREASRDLDQSIAHRAYTHFEQRGRIHGFDLEDWLRAEREIMLEASIH